MPFPRRTTSLIAALSLTLLAGALGACHSSSGSKPAADSASLPPASTLLSQAETAMGTVQTVHFTIGVSGTLSGLPLQKADGVLTKAGEAKGAATIVALGQPLEADFVLVGGSFYVKLLTGGYQKMSAAQATKIYDPSAILDPNRGISELLKSSSNAKTVAATAINGKTAYQVSLTPDKAAVDSLVPGLGANTTGSIWIDKATGHVVKGVFTVAQPGGKSATVTIGLDNYDAPVSISAP